MFELPSVEGVEEVVITKAGRGGNRATAAYLPGPFRSNQRRERLSAASAGVRYH
jgi:hypothetical protein